MQLLSLNFLFYTIGGVWRPIKWSSKCSTHLYSMLTFFTMYLLNFSVLTQLLDIIFIVDNMDDFATNLLMLLSAITAFCKAATAITRRSEIISLIKILQEKPCKACDEEEINIQMKYDRLIRQVCASTNVLLFLTIISLAKEVGNLFNRSCTISYTVLASFSTTGAITGQVLSTFHSELPHRIWVPYHYTPPSLFWLTSLHEMLALIVGTFVNVATETLLLGLCLQICAQLEILTHRLQREIKSNKGQQVCKNLNDTPNGTSRLSEHIYYHLCIIRFAEMANEIFSQVLFVQFFASILILCASVYYLSSPITVADFVTLIIFTFCMFVQIFIYCWAGNEVMLKILKTSYSAFNVLHRS
ncbi:PREDICTED: odorant receptor Or1-like isoform X2 [Vollenhovia emeryi]|uniref:odorant receptor Or1-like isoform X2 n=1 Tax=Vollenhovia emeryi TaxID=411798 RepID=UPI0005F4B6E4|nr:PREDICTED: odorant receptor Or1-like isoform X2 [Vollenhovia emeryi]